MSLQISYDFSTKPNGDILKLEIGLLMKGPIIILWLISFRNFVNVSNQLISAETKLLELTGSLGPVYWRRTPSLKPEISNSYSKMFL